MKAAVTALSLALLAFGCNATAQDQAGQRTQSESPQASSAPHSARASAHGRSPRPSRSTGRDIGSGSADIGKGAGRGAGNLAEGTGKGAADLVTLHPIGAATDIGKGAGSAGKNVAVGAGKGTGKIVKGTGKAIKHIF